MKLKRRNKVHAEISMTSLTDIVFILLIFILVTHSIQSEPILKLILPKGAISEVTVQQVKVRIDWDMDYYVDDKPVTIENLHLRMKEVLTQQPGATVSIKAHKSLPYETVMDVVYMVNKLDGKPVLALEPVK